MTTKIKIDIDANKILKKRGLEKNGETQKFFTHEVRRLCDPYVPFKDGPLKETAQEKATSIVYVQLYAKKNYFENKGHGLRGKLWDRRMVAQRGPELTKSVINFINRRGL